MKDFVRIGLSAGLNTGKNDAPRERGKAYVMNDYIQSVVRAGAVPVILPVLSDNELAEKLFDMVDGLILTGGGDLDPAFYGEDPHVKLGSVCRLRDDFDFKLLDFAVKKNIPVFGICRGHQLINTYFGGTLYQDVSLCKGSWIKHSQEKLFDYVEHKIQIQKDSWLGSFLGTDISVNSYHHQSVKKLVNGFKVTAVAMDGIIEAIEKEGKLFCVGVQWHPERMSQDNKSMQQIFNEFIKVCKKNGTHL
jgi:putative glutamine amidotransferase